MHIAIVGNIGVGKTTLVGLLARHYRCAAVYEQIEENPYLADFCQQMDRWALPLQLHALHKKAAQHLSIQRAEASAIQDRTLYEDVFIFSAHLHSLDLISHREYDTYLSLAQWILPQIPPPDLIVYLQASADTLLAHLSNSKGHAPIGIDYLQPLNQRYEAWAQQYRKGKLITINVDHLHFHENAADFEMVCRKIEAAKAKIFALARV